jgi:hypothetical protein
MEIGDIFVRENSSYFPSYYVFIGMVKEGLGIGDYGFSQINDPLNNTEVREHINDIQPTISVPHIYIERHIYRFIRNVKDGGIEREKKIVKKTPKKTTRKRVVRGKVK